MEITSAPFWPLLIPPPFFSLFFLLILATWYKRGTLKKGVLYILNKGDLLSRLKRKEYRKSYKVIIDEAHGPHISQLNPAAEFVFYFIFFSFDLLRCQKGCLDLLACNSHFPLLCYYRTSLRRKGPMSCLVT